MNTIAIDGACKRNGQLDCVSCGAIYSPSLNKPFYVIDEYSTNQRGELNALIEALKHVNDDTNIITDSEYIFNAMTKEWYRNWAANNWCGSSGDVVKNRDLWERVYTMMHDITYEVCFFHIKGHCITFGPKTAAKSLENDLSGAGLFNAVQSKYDLSVDSKKKNLEHAQELSVRNNGYRLDDATLKHFVTLNMMADLVASYYLEQYETATKYK